MNIVLILTSVLLNCAAQLCIRKGMLAVGELSMDGLMRHIGVMATNGWLWCAMVCYAVSIFLWMAALSKVEVSFAFPIGGIGYAVTALAGHYLLGESLSSMRVLGIVVICFGVYLVSRS